MTGNEKRGARYCLTIYPETIRYIGKQDKGLGTVFPVIQTVMQNG